ncbi:MAG: 5-methylcytosine-specific restriction endonuclease system specificity protein McrC [Erysipelotrichaceae bacterium]|jgi:5-methylcytosine-specific restriction enzyme subunit McrC|nr:5-methylcytosine-specific restriction endonuclease system specificity protein McrC [Erysipelotrichaceae bacterium]MCH4045080.1 5-methylcytosine-specific restriction endonuclease system specificity protein McrC [Erysipelotrichaceae bacterium]MCH4122291.1 5-methylcytosine-specific restriction endonuclease system specificity protein McrC [Erysipelotrichaceae bacterium]MCI1462222.1 5-methylcytosine-specific restriction endonuclease system specificity protein McrC [Solobacterium sp.]
MIPIKNIYYMLTYAFQVLNENGYKDIDVESFKNTADLMASILSTGVSQQIKRGLVQEYQDQQDALPSPRGKIDISASIKSRSEARHQLVCTYDEFVVDNEFNRILKSTMELLFTADITKKSRRKLNKLLPYFKSVKRISLKDISWNRRYDRNNQTYRMLIGICWLVANGMLQTTSTGTVKLMDFIDEQRMSHLYEKFILEYYRKEFSCLRANASQINWQLDEKPDVFLPIMQSDIMLSKGDKILIIDAKYYEKSLVTYYGKQHLHSQNLYQIFTYVKNKEAELRDRPHEVAGMLLYAKTDEEISPNSTYYMDGNQISVKTLDLNQDFAAITMQLNQIVEQYFGIAI